MSKKNQRKQRRSRRSGYNTHHILHYRRWWDKGFKQQLRRAFIYELPVDVHEKLHGAVGPVPPLDEDDARWLWGEFKRVDHEMELFEALAWLQMHAPTSDFAIAIMAQYGFLSNHLDRS